MNAIQAKRAIRSGLRVMAIDPMGQIENRILTDASQVPEISSIDWIYVPEARHFKRSYTIETKQWVFLNNRWIIFMRYLSFVETPQSLYWIARDSEGGEYLATSLMPLEKPEGGLSRDFMHAAWKMRDLHFVDSVPLSKQLRDHQKAEICTLRKIDRVIIHPNIIEDDK